MVTEKLTLLFCGEHENYKNSDEKSKKYEMLQIFYSITNRKKSE